MSFPFNFRPMDEEEFKKIQKAHMEHHQRVELMNQEFINRWIRFIDELSPEDKRTFVQWIQRMDSDDSQLWMNYWQGVVATALRLQHPEFCVSCGHTHDQISAPCQDIFGTPSEQVPDEALPVTQAGPPDPEPDTHDFLDANARVEAEYQADLKRYNLQPYTKRDENDTRSGFECTNCSFFYSSLAERMLRDEDECPGCIQKAKWG